MKKTMTEEQQLIKELYLVKNKLGIELYEKELMDHYDNEESMLDYELEKVKETKVFNFILSTIENKEHKDFYENMFNVSLYTRLLNRDYQEYIKDEDGEECYIYINDEGKEEVYYENEEGELYFNEKGERHYVDFYAPYFDYYGIILGVKKRFLRFYYLYLSLIEDNWELLKFMLKPKFIEIILDEYSKYEDEDIEPLFYGLNILSFVDYDFFESVCRNREIGVSVSWDEDDYHWSGNKIDLSYDDYDFDSREENYIKIEIKKLKRDNYLEKLIEEAEQF